MDFWKLMYEYGPLGAAEKAIGDIMESNHPNPTKMRTLIYLAFLEIDTLQCNVNALKAGLDQALERACAMAERAVKK